MSFTVSMVINGDASRALQAMEAANRAAQGLGRGISVLAGTQTNARGAASGLTQATAQMERSLRSSVSTAAMLPPRLDAMAAATARAVREQARLRPATDAATAASNRFARAMRNTASSIALMHGPLGGVASRFSALATIFTRMPAPIAAITVAVAALTFASTAGIRTFAQYESQLLTVEAVIRATGGAAGRTTEDIDRMALSVARGTLASAREVRAASAQLLTFRSIAGDTFDRTLVLAQDLAAVGFGSIEQGAVQLAKALEDPEQGLSALRRVGISFSAAQMEIIRNFHETGRVAEAQNAILAQVEAQVGGAGAAAGGGLAGAWDALTGATGRWFELVGSGTADISRLEQVLNYAARGIEGFNSAMSVDSDMARLRELQAEQQDLFRLLELDAERSAWNPLTWGRDQEAAAQAMLARINAINDEMLSIQRRGAQEAEAVAAQSVEAQAKAAKERVDAVITELERELEAVGLTAMQLDVLAAQRKAGVDAASEEGQEIARLVIQRHEEAEAIAASAAEQERANRQAETGRQRVTDLIASLNAELAVMQALDPVMRTMIGHRTALTFATATQAEEVRNLVAALEAEQRAQAFSAELDRLQFNTSIQSLSEVERRIAEAQRRLQVDPDSDQGRKLETEIRQNYAAEQARRARESAQRSGTRATKVETDAVSKLIHNLQMELDILRETDPVAQEMIRHREILAKATDEQRAAIEDLIRQLQQEQAELTGIEQAWADFGKGAYSALDDLIINGAKFEDVMLNVARAIQRAALEAVLLGTGPLAALFGLGGGGGMLGALGGVFGIAPVKKRDGGMIHGAGGPRDDQVPLMARPGDFIVNAAATARNRAVLEAIRAGGSGGQTVPVLASAGEFRISADQAIPNLGLLEAINAGVDVQNVLRPQRLAMGGMVSAPTSLPARASGPGRAEASGAAVVNHFHIQTQDARSFTTSRASVTRTARGLAERAGRFS